MAPSDKKPRAAKPNAAKPATRTRKPKAAKPPAATAVGFEHVAERAYFLRLEGAGGDPTVHWLQAERDLAAA